VSPLAALLIRLALDDAYRARFAEAPDAILEGLELSKDDQEILQRPDPAWLGLLARAVREVEVPVGPAWDPEAPLPGDDAEAAGLAPTPTTLRAEPGGPFDGLPEARLIVRLRPAEIAPGRRGWAASLAADDGSCATAPDEVALALVVAPAGTGVRAELSPLAPQAAPPPRPASWGHRADTRAVARAAAAVRGGEPGAVERLVQVVRAGGSPEPDEASEPPPSLMLLDAGLGAADITVVGLGLCGVDHLTREGEAALRAADRIFYVDAGIAAGAFLRALGPPVTALFGATYAVGEARLGTYAAIAAAVLRAALGDGGPPRRVALAVQGHPTYFSYVPVLLADVAGALGLRVRTLPGVSADAAIFAALAIDPGEHGLQSFEATDLLLRRRPLSPDVATLVWQVGNVETRLHSARPSIPARFVRLRDHLMSFFPADHPVRAVKVSPHPGVPTTVRGFALGELADRADALDAATTLYLPPVGRRPILDAELARLVDDPTHLARITRRP